jgi:serine/threonine-protein kinase
MAALGRYVLRERLGHGGMGEVFLAVTHGAAGFEKTVVVKRLLPMHAADATARALFMAEAMLLTKLGHPNVVSVIDFGVGERDDYFLVLEHVDGLDLGALLRAVEARGERISERVALRIAAQVLRGLAFAHELAAREQKTLVHRDVTPGNVLLSRAGEVKVADFGVTLLAERDATDDGVVAGKPGYMAPEQRTRGALDARTDVFAVGALVHRMLAGAPPPPVDDTEPAPPLEASAPVAALVARALAAAPSARFARAKEMLAAVEAEPMATVDELAELVERSLAEAPPRRDAVVVIGKARGAEETRGTEITLHRDAPAPRAKEPRARLPWVVALVALLAGGAVTAFVTLRTPARVPAASTPAASTSFVAPVEPPPPPPTTVPAPAASSAPVRAPSPRPTATPSASVAAPECRGAVWLRAEHAWTVQGAGVVAEAPDRTTWPCGTFDVIATSKLDRSDVRRLRITVSPNATATIDLR